MVFKDINQFIQEFIVVFDGHLEDYIFHARLSIIYDHIVPIYHLKTLIVILLLLKKGLI